MISTHVESFRIRSYECDLYGHVNNAIYLHYLQEASLSFLSAAGYPPDRCAALGLEWWPSRIDFEYLIPLQYGDTVEVSIHPDTISGPALQLSFEYHNQRTGDLVAKGSLLANLQDAQGGPLENIPPEIQAALTPEGLDPGRPGLPASPTAPPPPPGIFRIRKRVAWQDIHAKKELDPATLLVYAGECGRQVIQAHGWPMERMLEEGFAILLRSNQIEYYQPACLDDELELSTWVSNLRRVSALRHYTIHRVKDGLLLAQIHALGVWVNLSTGLPRRAPDRFLTDFAPNISTESPATDKR
jgi:YbgC/YbaW family acyl-CoA thioester hydrolase